MADSVGSEVAGTRDRDANLVRNFANLTGSRLVALHGSDPRRLKKSAARHPAARAVVPPAEPVASQASLEQGGRPVRLAKAGQEVS